MNKVTHGALNRGQPATVGRREVPLERNSEEEEHAHEDVYRDHYHDVVRHSVTQPERGGNLVAVWARWKTWTGCFRREDWMSRKTRQEKGFCRV